MFSDPPKSPIGNLLSKSGECTAQYGPEEPGDASQQACWRSRGYDSAYDMLKASKSKEARSARASMSAEDKDATTALEDERRARRLAEARAASLETVLQDQRLQLSTISLSNPSRNGNSPASKASSVAGWRWKT